LIDSGTNKNIKDKAPSVYLVGMEDGDLGPDRDRILESHKIDSAARQAMFADDYEAFVVARMNAIVDVIEAVTGKTVSRDVGGAPTP
jgi:hypothetical protein